MPPLKLRCPRCGCHLSVPEHKAGKHGKCPTCGGPIRVPTLEEAELTQAQHGPPSWMISAGVVIAFGVLFFAVVLLLQSGGGDASGVLGGPKKDTAVSDDGAPLQEQLQRIMGIEANLQSYETLLEREHFLHVRAINAKLYSYERLTPEELRFRDVMMETWQKDPMAAPDLSLAYAPLNEIEKGRYRQVLEEIRMQSNKILRAMRSAGTRMQMSPDPFGRKVLNLEEAKEKLVELRTQFQEGSSSPG